MLLLSTIIIKWVGNRKLFRENIFYFGMFFISVPVFHAICSIWELEPSTLQAICSIWELQPSILQHLGVGTFQFCMILAFVCNNLELDFHLAGYLQVVVGCCLLYGCGFLFVLLFLLKLQLLQLLQFFSCSYSCCCNSSFCCCCYCCYSCCW